MTQYNGLSCAHVSAQETIGEQRSSAWLKPDAARAFPYEGISSFQEPNDARNYRVGICFVCTGSG
jgi:hypothetical protein